MAFYYPLCSSSNGNAGFLGDAQGGILLDAGLSLREFSTALAFRDLSPAVIRGIFITHEHSDHIKGLRSIVSELHVPVYGSCETLEWLIENKYIPAKSTLIEIKKKSVTLADLTVRAFSTPHDSVHSLGYHVDFANGKSACLCTDLGTVTDEVRENLTGCDFVFLESNYDEELLWHGPYPPFLKRRIASDHGHLSNTDCADMLLSLFGGGCTHFLLGHLSETNNRPELAYACALERLSKTGALIGEDYRLSVAKVRSTGDIETI